MSGEFPSSGPKRGGAPPADPSRSEATGALPRWSAEEICGPGGEALIVLDGDVYRLRITARRRLILTK